MENHNLFSMRMEKEGADVTYYLNDKEKRISSLNWEYKILDCFDCFSLLTFEPKFYLDSVRAATRC